MASTPIRPDIKSLTIETARPAITGIVPAVQSQPARELRPRSQAKPPAVRPDTAITMSARLMTRSVMDNFRK